MTVDSWIEAVLERKVEDWMTWVLKKKYADP
jgi:hypothetical protein